MKAYKVTLLVIDHDKLGASAIESEIENVRYPNRCISPRAMVVEEADIGEWVDHHPLNLHSKVDEEFARLFLEDEGKDK